MKKRMIPMLLALVLIVAAASFSIQAADLSARTPERILADAAALEGKFPASGTYNAVCPACGTSKTWKPLTASLGANITTGDHYYMPNDFKGYQVFQMSKAETICVHTNGKTVNAQSRFCISGNKALLNIMGSGKIVGPGSAGMLYANGGTINVYGTTIESTATPALSLYNASTYINVYGGTLIANNNPTINGKGTVRICDTTVTGQPADLSESTAKLIVANSSITGIQASAGTVSLSGAAKVTGTGLVLGAGKLVDLSDGLREGADILLSANGVFTAAGNGAFADYFTPAKEGNIIVASADGVLSCVPEGTLLIGKDGSIVAAEDVMAAWATGNYAYIKLHADDAIADLGGAEILVDINGNDLTVGGSGKVCAFDSANDSFNAACCGSITAGDAVEIALDVLAPNGGRYIAVTEEKTTMHRLDVRMQAVTLRASAAGLYYKAVYHCDDVLAAKVKNYGVVLSLDDMPGSDFLSDADSVNCATRATAPFESGVVATSGSVFGIMKDRRDAEKNAAYGEMEIYANAYIQLDIADMIVVGDTENPGKTTADADFSGVAWSLREVMDAIDDTYYDYASADRQAVDSFRSQWDAKGMGNWKFRHVGDGVDNSDLVLDAEQKAYCPVCKKIVVWTALRDETTKHNINGHYYLAKDINFTGDPAEGFIYNGTKETSLCLHLNGHNITATQSRAFFGSSGVLNVMGNGVVSGYNKSSAGAALQLNNGILTNGTNIYGGTWKKASNASAKAAVLGVYTVGGKLNVYKGAVIDGSGSMAVQVMTPGSRDANLGLYGCTVKGDVVLTGADPAKSYTSTAVLVDCVINGNVDIPLNNIVYLSGKPVIDSVTRHEDQLLNIGALSAGASIGMATDGVFTNEIEKAADYTAYFHSTDAAGLITVRDNALYCGRDYIGNLVFAEGTQDALCPACGKMVTWTPVDGSAAITNTAANHYYLTQDVTFTASNGELSFFSPGHGNYSVCFHLNGHDFTATNTRFIYGGTSTANIMGNGTVTGSRNDKTLYGSTVQINTGNASGTINLYGGVWKQAEGGVYATDYVISISDNGGTVNIHENAVVEANSNGKAVYVGASAMRDSLVEITGTVKGVIYSSGAKQDKGFASEICVDGGSVQGTLDANGDTSILVEHDARIELLDAEESVLVSMSAMQKGADITVLNAGVFTQANAQAADWADYFHPYYECDKILVQDNALRCKTDYAGEIVLDAEGKAFCPVCRAKVSWTAVSSGESRLVAEAGAHYYLTADIVYQGAYDANGAVSFLAGGSNASFKGTSACFHLNGHNITSTLSHGIYGGWGELNIMGAGIVTGYAKGSIYGGAAQINNSLAGNSLNLYSGTYRNAANSAANSVAVAVGDVGGKLCIYEDAVIANSGVAVRAGTCIYRDTNLEIYGATIQGGVAVKAPGGDTYSTKLVMEDATVIGEVSVESGNQAAIDGRAKISKLTLGKNVLVDFTNMKDGSDITVSADGIFSGVMPLADDWLKYITCADDGDWIIVRDKQFYQEVRQEISAATDADKQALDAAYSGATVKYGEMHDHTNSGPRGGISTGADGNNSLVEWKAEMDRLGMEFATIVDHGMSIHMYYDEFDKTYFVGGTEPGTTITDSKAAKKTPHYNMLFSDPKGLEAIFFKWEKKFTPTVHEGYEGYRVKYPTFTTAEFAQLAMDVYAQGGLLVHVHPKYDSYIYSNDPMDYYFADYTGLEITTGSGGNMMTKDNEEGYQLWVDLLEMGKKIYATAGSDKHRLPNLTALTTMYTAEDHADTYMAHMRSGNFAPGWVGIRMNVGGTAMGGETDFAGKRLQFSVGDIYNSGQTDAYNTAPVYVAGHTYRVELYDDGGLLMSSVIDPTQLNYFAIDCDETAKFYRVVVWDETDNERIGVSNPIWNN